MNSTGKIIKQQIIGDAPYFDDLLFCSIHVDKHRAAAVCRPLKSDPSLRDGFQPARVPNPADTGRQPFIEGIQ